MGGRFSRVAGRYDLMNDLMSLGTITAQTQVAACPASRRSPRPDLAGGTGDKYALFAPAVGEQGRVI